MQRPGRVPCICRIFLFTYFIGVPYRALPLLLAANRPEYERRVREVVEASWVADPEGAAAAATMIEAGDLEDMSGGPDEAVAAAVAGEVGGSSSSAAGSSSSAGGAPSAASEPAVGAAVGGAGSAAAATAP